MNNEDINNWVSLLSEVDILRSSISQVESVSHITSEDDDFSAYEARVQVRFTEDYKAFCQTFGDGCFGNGWISILAPDKNKMETQLADQEDIFYVFEGHLCCRGNSEFVPTLDESYLFGIAQGVIFVFGRDTGKDRSLNSDIYAIDESGNLYDFGKDFLGFVKDCCLGKGIEKKFPRLLDCMVPLDKTINQLVAPTFTPLGW